MRQAESIAHFQVLKDLRTTRKRIDKRRAQFAQAKQERDAAIWAAVEDSVTIKQIGLLSGMHASRIYQIHQEQDKARRAAETEGADDEAKESRG